MDNNIKQFLETAYNELGYLEKSSKKDLDDKTANAGTKNYTKYARDCFPELQANPWCCMFVWWCLEKTFGKIMARNLVGEKTAKCSTMKQRMLNIGCKTISNAKEGDLIFFDRGSGICHIGIVYSIGDKAFSTIEGNTLASKSSADYNKIVPNGGGVFVRAYNYGNINISDFVRPKWELLQDNNDKSLITKYIISGANVNIRAGAGTHCGWVGVEKKGYQLNVIGSALDPSGREWYKIIYKGREAYISAKYVEKEEVYADG